MHPFRYSITLRISQSVFTKRQLSQLLNMEPEPGVPQRQIIRGRVYWFKNLAEGETTSVAFEEALELVIRQLLPHEKLFRLVSQYGKSPELHIALFCERRCGYYVSHQLMAQAARLNLHLGFHIHPAQSAESAAS